MGKRIALIKKIKFTMNIYGKREKKIVMLQSVVLTPRKRPKRIKLKKKNISKRRL